MLSSACARILVIGLCAWGAMGARGDEPPSRKEIARRAKGATALLEFQNSYATAFCVHGSGLFITNNHAIESHGQSSGSVTLVLDSGLKTQKVLKAEVVRHDGDLDLALLHVAGEARDMPSLPLGSDQDLDELAELIALGFPFGKNLAASRQYPAISINLGSVTSLRRDEKGDLHRIQLDAELNPGNSGGPVLNGKGEVVGVVQGGIRGSGVNLAIPVNHLKKFLARPEILFQPPAVPVNQKSKPMDFKVDLVSVMPTTAPFEVDLVLGSGRQSRKTPMKLVDGAFRASAIPFPNREGPIELTATIFFETGRVTGVISDRDVHIAGETAKLSQLQRIQFGDQAAAILRAGRKITGKPKDLAELAVRLGGQTFTADLGSARSLTIQPPDPIDAVPCGIVVRQEGKDIGLKSAPLYLEGAEEQITSAIRDGHFSKPLRSPYTVTYIQAISSSGDFIGKGKTYRFLASDIKFQPTTRGVNLKAGGYDFLFCGPNGSPLEPLEYGDAKRTPFAGESPGIEIYGNGSGCNEILGRFVVWEIAMKGNKIVRLAIDFTQRCEKKGPPLYGRIRLNSTFY